MSEKKHDITVDELAQTLSTVTSEVEAYLREIKATLSDIAVRVVRLEAELFPEE